MARNCLNVGIIGLDQVFPICSTQTMQCYPKTLNTHGVSYSFMCPYFLIQDLRSNVSNEELS